MKALEIILEALAAAAIIVLILSDPWWQSTIGLFAAVVGIAAVLLCAWLYGCSYALKRWEQSQTETLIQIGKAEASARHRQRSAKMAEKTDV